MKIASFNINGIKARLHTLSEWLTESAPDIVLLQEIKSTDDAFPRAHFEDLGYNVETHGQKGFNGVAILSRYRIEDSLRGLPLCGGNGAPNAAKPDVPDGADTPDAPDMQARWLEATIATERASVRVVSLYLPNGNPVESPKYSYKLEWMQRFKARAQELLATEEAVVLGGDYNVIAADRDAHDPEKWRFDALGRAESRTALREILALGYYDALRCCDPVGVQYSFWDFQKGAWERNDGIRIDAFLLSPEAADRLMLYETDTLMRGRTKPSDHVPIRIELDMG